MTISDRVLIYRTADRPKYLSKSLPHLLNHTNPGTPIIVVHNSNDSEARDLSQHVLRDFENEIIILEFDQLLGGTQTIVVGLEHARSILPDLKYVLVTDDDVLCPLPAHGAGTMHYWDDVLVKMLAKGWLVAAHPWSQSFRTDDTGHKYREPTFLIKDDPESAGYIYSGVGGGCSAFRLEAYDERPFQNYGLIRGYNEWMIRFEWGSCGYSFNHLMTINHFDRPEHKFSLRDAEYEAWSNEMYYQRWPDRRNPKHPNHKRPHGSKGVW